jgi:uncharacterized protein (DUF302 family)
MKKRNFLTALIVLLVTLSAARADDLIMRRIPVDFPETMTTLQSSIIKQGYRVSRVQRVDIGLTSSGYDTAEYRLVFFIRPDQLDMIEKQHPDLIPFVPLKITIFAEGNETILVTLNPLKLNEFFPDAGLGDLFAQWENDIIDIFDRVQSEQ